MQTCPPKGLIPVFILDILYKKTDDQHTLTQREIEVILEDEYGMKVDRKSVGRNLANIIDSGIADISYTEKRRVGRNPKTGEKEESRMLTDFSINRDITSGEIRYLVDGIFASKHIPEKHRKELVAKLEVLGGPSFDAYSGSISKDVRPADSYKELFYNIQVLDEAIRNKRKVKFKYKGIAPNGKPELRTSEDGKPRIYVINPYQMVVKDGNYYLICNNDKLDSLSNYRVERISDIETLDERAKPLKAINADSSIKDYVKEHLYMFTGKSVRAEIQVKSSLMGNMSDSLGGSMKVISINEENGFTTFETTINEEALTQFAKRYIPDLIVVKPRETAERIFMELEKAISTYKDLVHCR